MSDTRKPIDVKAACKMANEIMQRAELGRAATADYEAERQKPDPVVWVERCFRSPFTGRLVTDVRMTVSEEEAQRILAESAGQRVFWRVVERPFESPQTEIATL